MARSSNAPDPLVLASGSPRRAALLGSLGLALQRAPPEVDESPLAGERAHDYVRRLARVKGRSVAQAHPARVVVAADTCVVLDERLLGKPKDVLDARRTLAELAGREHEVVTGVWAAGPRGEAEALVSTRVRFRALSAEEIAWYVETGEPMDKAGSYAIQERGGAFVEAIDGSYSNVVGLPLAETLALLAKVGQRLPWEEP